MTDIILLGLAAKVDAWTPLLLLLLVLTGTESGESVLSQEFVQETLRRFTFFLGTVNLKHDSDFSVLEAMSKSLWRFTFLVACRLASVAANNVSLKVCPPLMRFQPFTTACLSTNPAQT